MKKLATVLILLAITALYFTNGFVNMTSYLKGDYSFYNKSFTNTYLFSKTVTLTGEEPLSAQIERLKTQNVRGESVTFQGDTEDIDKFIDIAKVEVISEQSISGVYIIYGYSYRLKGSVILNDKKINVQIAKRGTTITIGTPLIFGSY